MPHLWRLLPIAILCYTACSSPSEERRVAALEQAFQQATADHSRTHTGELRTLSDEMIQGYRDLVRKNPQDPRAAEYLFKAARMCEFDTHKLPLEMELLAQIRSQYPHSERAAYALMKQAFLTHNVLRDLPRAKALYSEFLQTYPQHDLVPVAKQEIALLGQ
jgi:TolA-binding protein